MLAIAFLARVLGADAFRTALRFKLAVRLAPPVLFRVDFRLGLPVAESSNAAPPFFAARFEALRAAVELPPAVRCVALTPGFAVSTSMSRRGLDFFLGFGGFAARAAFALNTSDRVAMCTLYNMLAHRRPRTGEAMDLHSAPVGEEG